MTVYNALNLEIISHIPPDIIRVLDFGCGDGSLGEYLQVKRKAEVVGLTYSQEEATIARKKITKVIVADINSIELGKYGQFDCIVCSHVLEHLYEPEALLNKIKSILTAEGFLIIALPNILFWKQRLKLLSGSFKYTEGGLMDRTHFRFYDWKEAQAMIVNNGFRIIEAKAYGSFPLPLIKQILPKNLGKGIDTFTCQLFPGLFGFQFIFSCQLKK